MRDQSAPCLLTVPFFTTALHVPLTRNRMATACLAATVLLLSGGVGSVLRAQEVLCLKGHKDGVGPLAFSPDGKTLVTACFQELKCWDLATGKECYSLDLPKLLVRSVAFSPDGKTLAYAAHEINGPSTNNNVQFLDATTGKEIGRLKGETDLALTLSYSPDGKLLAWANVGGSIKIWNVKNKKTQATLESRPRDSIFSLAFSPDGKTLVSSHGGGHVRVWDIATAKELHALKANTTSLRRVRYRPDGKSVAFIHFNGTSVQAWDPDSGKTRIVLEPETDQLRVSDFAFSPDGKLVANGTMRGRLELRDAKTWELLAGLPAHQKSLSVAFSPDGKRLATCSMDKTVKVWDVAKLLGQSDKK